MHCKTEVYHAFVTFGARQESNTPWHNNIDDHGRRRGDTAPILTRWQQPVALSEAPSMPHKAANAASSWVATMVIKTDQNNQQNHVSNCVFLMYYSYVHLLRSRHCHNKDRSFSSPNHHFTVPTSPVPDQLRSPSLLYYVPDGTLICSRPTINGRHVD